MITYKCTDCGFVASGFDALRIRDERKQHKIDCPASEPGFIIPKNLGEQPWTT